MLLVTLLVLVLLLSIRFAEADVPTYKGRLEEEEVETLVANPTNATAADLTTAARKNLMEMIAEVRRLSKEMNYMRTLDEGADVDPPTRKMKKRPSPSPRKPKNYTTEAPKYIRRNATTPLDTPPFTTSGKTEAEIKYHLWHEAINSTGSQVVFLTVFLVTTAALTACIVVCCKNVITTYFKNCKRYSYYLSPLE